MSAYVNERKEEISISMTLEWGKELQGRDLNDTLESKIPISAPLNYLHRKMEQLYKDLPWPPKIKRATVMTEAPGGRGDIAAAAKVISILQNERPDMEFDWIVFPDKFDRKPFLTCNDSSKVNIKTPKEESDLLIVGPAKFSWSTNYIQKKYNTKIEGPKFAFLEAGTEPDYLRAYFACKAAREPVNEKMLKIHKRLFPTVPLTETDSICMGLLHGSGIFFDQSRLDATLSHGYCCPKELLGIEDNSLRIDILESMGLNGGEGIPDYHSYSLNSGYAHRPTSWCKFIDFVAIHEKDKEVTIVLNQHGEFDKPNIKQYAEIVFTPERLKLLEELGYGTIKLKGEGDEVLSFSTSGHRRLTVIVRPSFKPQEMKHLQLASERLIATGMNTPAESWASRCKLYIYEDVGNGGVTDKFLNQQVVVANKVNPKLGRLLEIAGQRNEPLSVEEMKEAREILEDSELADATLQLCEHITKNYRFQDALISSLKRTLWHHCIPQLAEVEAEAMDDDFKKSVIDHFSSFHSERRVVEVRNLPLVGERVKETVEKFLLSQS